VNLRPITFRGQTKTIAEWSRTVGISHDTIAARLDRGWTVERALTERPDNSQRDGHPWRKVRRV